MTFVQPTPNGEGKVFTTSEEFDLLQCEIGGLKELVIKLKAHVGGLEGWVQRLCDEMQTAIRVMREASMVVSVRPGLAKRKAKKKR